MQNPLADKYRRLWVAAGIALLLVIFLLSWVNTKLSNVAAPSKAQTTDTASLLHLSPADAARRAAIAELGPIDTPPKSNAADTYKRAMALYNKLTPAEREILTNWRANNIEPAVAAALSAKLQPILQLLALARTQGPSDWGDNPLSSAGRDARINMMLGLTQAAQWQANYQFQSDPAGALQNLADAEALDRNSSNVMYGYANYSSLHDDTVALIAQNARALSPLAGAPMPDLSYLTDPEGVTETMQSILNAQAAQLQSVVDQYANPATRAQAAQFITNDFNAYGADPASAVNAMQFVLQTDQQLADNLTDTNTQFQAWLSQVKSQAASLPAINWAPTIIQHQYDTFENSEILDAMLNAGVALQQGNQALSQSIVDPVTGQPFDVAKILLNSDPQQVMGTSFNSTFSYDGKPVSLRVGTQQIPMRHF